MIQEKITLLVKPVYARWFAVNRLSGKSWVHTGCTALANLTVGDTVKVTGDSSNTASPYISNGMGFNGHLVQRYW